MQNAHINYDIDDFHRALLTIIGVMNHPLRDMALMRAAEITLDQVLFPLLVTVERFGPIGVVDLANRVGRDYTTVSRQVKKLEQAGLVVKKSQPQDKRVSELTISEEGKAMTMKIDAARQRLMNASFDGWEPDDVQALFRLVQKYAQTLMKQEEAA